MNEWKEVEIPDILKPMLEDDAKRFEKGDLAVFVGTMPNGKKHISISHPSRFPTWDEIKDARYTLLPDGLDMAIYLPSKAEYVNIHNNCFHLFECKCYRSVT